MNAPFGMLGERPATFDEWFLDTTSQNPAIVDGPKHVGGDNCHACKLTDEWLDTRTARQNNEFTLDKMLAARIVFREHTRVGDRTEPDENALNMCDCKWCWMFVRYLSFRLFASFERGEIGSNAFIEMLSRLAADELQENEPTGTSEAPIGYGLYL